MGSVPGSSDGELRRVRLLCCGWCLGGGVGSRRYGREQLVFDRAHRVPAHTIESKVTGLRHRVMSDCGANQEMRVVTRIPLLVPSHGDPDSCEPITPDTGDIRFTGDAVEAMRK